MKDNKEILSLTHQILNEFKQIQGGFQITFSNGWTVSVQLERTYEEGEAIAEIAAFKGDGPDKPWHYFEEGDFVKRWCTPDEVLDFMNLIKEK